MLIFHALGDRLYYDALPLEPRTRLGHYEVVCAVGTGGMGVVYRAIDNRLKRTVALKDSGPIRYISAGNRVAGKQVASAFRRKFTPAAASQADLHRSRRR